jgi:hypothetical protein
MAKPTGGGPAMYRFGDASRVGVLLGLSGRQVVPLTAGVLLWAVFQQFGGSIVLSLVWPVAGVVLAFGRVGGAPLAEVLIPGSSLLARRARGRATWTRTSLLGAGPGYEDDVPPAFAGLELLAAPSDVRGDVAGMAVVRDTVVGTLTAVLRVRGHGFALASSLEQDAMVGAWGAALAPFARERSPVSRVVWHEWAHPVGMHAHQAFLVERGVRERDDPLTRDYLGLVDTHAGTAITHDLLIAVTVDQRRIRSRRATSATAAAMEALCDEVGLFADRVGNSLNVLGPLRPAELVKTTRIWSDPTKAAQLETYARSLAAATGRGSIEWGPMAVETAWRHVAVDGSVHRTYRVASWPMLPVTADWLDPLLSAAQVTRTVTVVMEPVPISKAARAAEREVMTREADADDKTQRGFRVSARDRKRLDQVTARENELAQGHPEFRFVGLVDVAATTLDALDDAAAQIEQAAAQSLLDLRPLDARHERGWIANLPLGRTIAPAIYGP